MGPTVIHLRDKEAYKHTSKVSDVSDHTSASRISSTFFHTLALKTSPKTGGFILDGIEKTSPPSFLRGLGLRNISPK